MRERILAFLTSMRELWNNASRKARLIFLISVAGVLILALALTLWLNHKEYVVLFNDLNTTENAQVIAVLNDAVIPYTVDNGRLLVESKDEGKARLQLAVLGFENAGFNYDIANSGGLTATQQDKERNELHGLQNRLQAAIELFPEISRAVVTISLPEKSMFALQSDETAPTASIVITKKPGRKLNADQVRGIVNIVRSSVQGLTEANISIVDSESGDLKSTLDLNEDYNNKKLELTEQVSRSLRGRILNMIQAPYGLENIQVEVIATLNTDSSVKEQTTYQPVDPTNPTNNPLDYAEFDREKSGDGFPAAAGVPGAQDNVQTPQYAAQEADAANSQFYSGHDVYDYLVSSLREQIVKDGFVIERASASILINATTLPEGVRDSVIALASNASGIPPENITVQNIPFAQNEPPQIIPPRDIAQLLIISGIGLLALCIILIIVLTALSKRNKARLAAEAAAAEAAAAEIEYDENGVPLIDLINQEDEDFEPIALVESAEQKLKLQIKDLAESDPEIVAQLIKTWLTAN